MSPSTRAALRTGRNLNQKQFREYVDDEARLAGLNGREEAIQRALEDVPPKNYREMRVRLLLKQLNVP